MSLQANWYESSLHVWEGRLPTEELRAAVAEASGDALTASIGEPATLKLWLPVDGTLQAALVTTLRFNPAEAVDLLVPLSERGEETCADSVRYWGTLARFVMQRIAHEQFFPTVENLGDGTLSAAWRLLIAEPELVDRFDQFASAMPPVCRAIVAAAPIDPAPLIESFLAVTTDALIRRDVSHDPFFERAHHVAQEPQSPIEVRWLSALLGRDRIVRAPPHETRWLAEQVRHWAAHLDQIRADEPWRLALELDEPPDQSSEADALWTLRFGLTVPGEEKEILDAAELWQDRAEAGAILGRKLAARRSQLLSELAAAADVMPSLGRAAQSRAPSDLQLSTADALLFIRHFSPQLRERGFEVRLPDWATRGPRTPGLLLSVMPLDDPRDTLADSGFDARVGSPSGFGRFGLESLLDFDWRVALGDVHFSPQEFVELAERGVSLIRHEGKWVQIDSDAAQRAASFLSKRRKGKMTLAQAFQTAFAATTQADVPIVGISGTSWVNELLEQAPGARLQKLEQPREFNGTLRPYQLRGLEWLAFLNRLGIGAILADDMGLGKTIQLIALLLQERVLLPLPSGEARLLPLPPGEGRGEGELRIAPEGVRVGPTLLFAPTSVVGNWAKELARFSPSLRVLVHHGPQRMRGEEFIAASNEHDVVITSYALAHRDVSDLHRVAWHRIALDEAQKVKNPYAAATTAIRSIPAPHRVAMTGTPIENHLSELWSIMEVLNPGLLGSASDFRDRFAMPIEKLGDQERAGQLKKLIQPFILRRSKSDPLIAGDLPEKMEMRVFCNLTPEQAAIYQRITDEMLGQVDRAEGIRRRALVLSGLTRLKQVCDHPNLVIDGQPQLDARSGKCERLVEMLEEVLEEGDAALVFTQFREMGHLLEKLLPERLRTPVQFLHGGTPQNQREQMIERFQRPGSDIRIFLLSLRAGGLGLNLTAANHVFHFDRWWNPAVEAQATDRAHRIGQTRKVQVHKFVCMGTVEERIDQLLSDKILLADRIVGSGDEWLTGLSTEDLRKTLELSEAAIAEYQ